MKLRGIAVPGACHTVSCAWQWPYPDLKLVALILQRRERYTRQHHGLEGQNCRKLPAAPAVLRLLHLGDEEHSPQQHQYRELRKYETGFVGVSCACLSLGSVRSMLLRCVMMCHLLKG